MGRVLLVVGDRDNGMKMLAGLGGEEGWGDKGLRSGDGGRWYLAAGIRPHGDVAVRSACETGVDARAIGSLALFAVEAAPIGDVERHDYAIALLEECHPWAHFFDDAHVFMT